MAWKRALSPKTERVEEEWREVRRIQGRGGGGGLESGRHEREFRFHTYSQDSLVNYFSAWVRNTVFHSHSQSQKLETLFFIPIPNPKIWENCFSFPFQIVLGNKEVSMHPFSVHGVKFT